MDLDLTRYLFFLSFCFFCYALHLHVAFTMAHELPCLLYLGLLGTYNTGVFRYWLLATGLLWHGLEALRILFRGLVDDGVFLLCGGVWCFSLT